MLTLKFFLSRYIINKIKIEANTFFKRKIMITIDKNFFFLLLLLLYCCCCCCCCLMKINFCFCQNYHKP